MFWLNEARHTIGFPQTYDLFASLRFSRMGRWDPTIQLSKSQLNKAFWYESERHLITARVDVDHLKVVCKSTGDVLPKHELICALGLHKPAFAPSGHRAIEKIVRDNPGVHPARSLHLGLDLARTVMQQLIEWRDAATAWRRWNLDVGSPVPGVAGLYFPPSYQDMHDQSVERLTQFGISRRRAQLIRELGRLGPRIDGWSQTSLVDLRRKLLTVPLLGPWTVDHCLGMSLNDADAVPLGDFQLPHTVAWVLEGKARSNDAEMVRLLEPWSGQRWSVLRMIFASDIRAPRRGPRLDLGRASRPQPPRRPRRHWR